MAVFLYKELGYGKIGRSEIKIVVFAENLE